MSERTVLGVAGNTVRTAKWDMEYVKWYRPFLRAERRTAFYTALIEYMSVLEDVVEARAQKEKKR
jgi:hypothetical protein